MSLAPVALVTGSSRGIGRAIALELAGAGYDVAVHCARDEAKARGVASEVAARGRRAAVYRADLGSRADRERLVEGVRRELGRIDLLVNNAATTSSGRADLLEAAEEGFDEVIAVNLKGPHFLTQAVARWMIELRKAHPERPMSIINISSMSEYTPSVNRGDYCIAKAGLGMVTRLWASRLAEHGIRVNEVRPGIIATDMTAPVKDVYDRRIAEGLTPIRRWGAPEDVARAVRALASSDFDFSTAIAIDVDGGFHLHRL
ncbi:MAG: 3-ketoacyl-ACP reductase [Planctomycetes bacterium]|nr:3-ketoacyl-ACP reductase [Planctomycetota bacterium]